MSIKVKIRYKFDLSALEDQTEPFGRRKNPGEPIGMPAEYVGSIDDIKRRICSEIDRTYLSVEDMYWDND